MLLPRCWFDAAKCEQGLETLTHYKRDFNTRIGEFIARPVHDWASHGADAFRYLAVRYELPRSKPLQINPKDYDEDDALWKRLPHRPAKTWQRGASVGPRGGC